LPELTLVGWMVLLLLASNGQQSLMAHDEGYYAQQARWIWETGDWYTVRWWDDLVYDRTIGLQWLIAASYSLFGLHEWSARLPSFLACLLSVILTYRIGCRLLNPLIAWLGSAILGVTALWVQYGRLATQDMTLVCLELIGIWALLQVEAQSRWRFPGGLLAGSMFGLGFLIKGFMVVLPGMAIVPYLLGSHFRYKHLFNPGLWLGLLLGWVPVGLWFWASWQHYGPAPFEQLFGKLFLLSKQDWHGGGPLFYLWNLPLNAFPWPLFSLFGAAIALRRADRSRLWLLLGHPLLLFLALSSFKTRTPYYALQLLPFMSLLAGLALDRLVQRFHQAEPSRNWTLATLSYGFGGLAVILLIAGSLGAVGIWNQLIGEEGQTYAPIALLLGAGWLLLPIAWLKRQYWPQAQRYWLAGWLLGPWLAMGAVGLTGLLGDFNPHLKAALQQPEIRTILEQHPINFAVEAQPSGDDHKTWVLLSFYTPRLGIRVQEAEDLPKDSFAWVSPSQIGQLPSRDQPLGEVRHWQLRRAIVPSFKPTSTAREQIEPSAISKY